MDYDENHIWRGRDVLKITIGVGFLFLLGLAVIAALAYGFHIQDFFSGQPTLLLSVSFGFLEAFALAGGVYFFGLRPRKYAWRVIFRDRLSIRWLFICLGIAVIAIPVSAYLAVFIRQLLGRPLESPQLSFMLPQGFSWPGLIGMLVSVGILAPIAEEIYFRGVIFRWLRGGWKFWPSALISSVIFGLLHGEISVAIAAFVLGLILAYAYEKSNSLWGSIAIHIANNSINILLLYLAAASGMPVS
jgi:uncharacterized protein